MASKHFLSKLLQSRPSHDPAQLQDQQILAGTPMYGALRSAPEDLQVIKPLQSAPRVLHTRGSAAALGDRQIIGSRASIGY